MTKMTAAQAAVWVLEKEGVTQAFGVPGAAINPLYSAMRKQGTIAHILARHVEGASHMAEGYTRAAPGNIGVCIGTSGPAGTDMITGLYSAQADSIPILCITGQAPRARLYKEDFQAVDIESIAKTVTKWAVTVREPAQVPRAFQQAFHLMRSGRPGPVLIDLPFDVQTTEIEFDPETYAPLPVYKPLATRAQAEKAIAMLQQAQRPLVVAGGGIINADASALLVEFAELTGVPVIPTLMAWGAIPDDHPLMAGMCGLQTSHRYGNATMLASDFVLGIGNRWANRHTGSIEVYTKGRTFVHVDIEPTQIGRVFSPDYGIASDAKAALQLFVEVARELKAAGAPEGPHRLGGRLPGAQADHAAQDPLRQRADEAAARLRGDEPRLRARHLLHQHHWPVADRRRPAPARVHRPQLDQLRPRPARSAGRYPRRWACAPPIPRAASSRSRATTTSSS
jgi:tartronate-semialdehyde synthase